MEIRPPCLHSDNQMSDPQMNDTDSLSKELKAFLQLVSMINELVAPLLAEVLVLLLYTLRMLKNFKLLCMPLSPRYYIPFPSINTDRNKPYPKEYNAFKKDIEQISR